MTPAARPESGASRDVSRRAPGAMKKKRSAIAIMTAAITAIEIFARDDCVVRS
jgi:hypothetical protein